MTKCKEKIAVQGIDFHLELENPDEDCEVDSSGRQHRIIIDNKRANSIEVDQESESIDQHVVFGNPSTYSWDDSVVVTRRRTSNPSTTRCSETAYADDPDNTDVIETEIEYQDKIHQTSLPAQVVIDDIEVDVC